MAQELQRRHGRSVIFDNRSGASGMIGAGYVAKSAPDGYTLLINAVADVTVPHYLAEPYDIRRDFSAIGMVADGPPRVLVVRSSSPYKTVQELAAAARASRGKLTFGGSGRGASPSIAVSRLKSMANIDVVEVPYRGEHKPLSRCLPMKSMPRLRF
ncbi:MAG: hypothetical protein HY056_07065 [Proteobacteria bacterium]|nr:hypothetical protein [Pseudomonadota bacterium]